MSRVIQLDAARAKAAQAASAKDAMRARTKARSSPAWARKTRGAPEELFDFCGHPAARHREMRKAS